jgi:uncharacterized protein YfcZ (UPF0381/DUF406 family)
MKKLIEFITVNWKSVVIAIFMFYVLYDLSQLRAELRIIDSSKSNMNTIRSELRSLASNVNSIESRLVDNNMKSTKTSPIPHNVNIRTNQSYSRSNKSETDLYHLKSDIRSLESDVSSIESKLSSLERTIRLER